jgi:exopolyphosphatase
MEAFLAFILSAKKALDNLGSHKNLHLVLGNESCDLDSTVSALSLAFLIHSQNSTKNADYLVIPVLNVEAKYFPLRTEICYLLKKYGIDPNILIFKDQIEYTKVLKGRKVKTSIVDHHVLSSNDKILEKTVVQIFDHRTINSQEICQNKNIEKILITTVGSCATLIANEIIESKVPILFNELCQLLYATIIYDTIGLDKECGKTFEEDMMIVQHLENILKPTESRKELFDVLWKIHNDTSSLSTKDLLYRDLKVVKGVPMPGLPLLVKDYLKRPDADVAITAFAKEFNNPSVVLIGIDASKEVKRDVAIFSTDASFKESLTHILKNSKEIAGCDLSLSEVATKNKNVVCFRQGNIKLTRKFILPLVDRAAGQVTKK